MGIIASFDLPLKLIDQDSREMRIYNHSSSNDHATHFIGIKEMDDITWFLNKDSPKKAYTGLFKGYLFYREDYVKLKILTATMHNDAAYEILLKNK